MTDLSVTQYNPYNMYRNFGYNYPAFRGTAIPADTGCSNVPQPTPQPDTVSFSAENQIQAKTKKQGLSTAAKVAIGVGVSAVLAVGADFLFCKGKHVKSLLGKNNKGHLTGKTTSGNSTKPAEAIEQTIKETAEASMINPLDKSKAIKINEFESLSRAVEDYRTKMNSGNYGVPKDIESMLDSLSVHNYGKDKSYIQVVTRSLEHDYVGRVLDIENNELYKTRVLINNMGSGLRFPDGVSEYLITTLPTGQKVVSIALPTGRFDPRPIRIMLSVLSKDKEFTPLQKDLIKIISNRKEVLTERTNSPDIMSIGVLAKDKFGYKLHEDPIEINKEVLLSSISKAKESLNDNIDKEFIEKALNVKGDERITNYFSKY